MERIGIVADRVVDALLKAQLESNDPDCKTIWAQKVAEVARRKEKHNEAFTHKSA